MSRFILFIPVLFIAVFLNSCTESTEPENDDQTPYMMLNVGDARQYYRIENNDTLTVFWEITGTARRSDDSKVFIGKWQYGTDTSSGISYYMIKDGYFVATELEPVEGPFEIKSNPYREQRLAKVYPKAGDSWVHTPGDAEPDTFRAVYAGKISTSCGEFQRVYRFRLKETMNILYAPGFGHIGAESQAVSDGYKTDVSLCYIKVNGQVRGKLMPAMNFSNSSNAARIKKMRINPFLQF